MILKIGTLKDWKIAIRTRRSTEQRFAKKIDERRSVPILAGNPPGDLLPPTQSAIRISRRVRLSFLAAGLQSLAFPISLALIK
jgi:hypothetical protein